MIPAMRIHAALLSLLIATICFADGTAVKPDITTREQWGSKPDPIPDSRKQVPVWITIHHAGELWTNKHPAVEFVRNMQTWGKKRPQLEQPPRNTYWPDLPYHFLIAPDGEIFEGRDIQYEPESNTNYSVNGNIGIEMMGNFEAQRPSLAQVKSCVKLTAWLSQQYKISSDHIRTHRDAAPGQTTCPGADFYRYIQSGDFLKWVAQAAEGKDPQIDLGPPLPKGPTTSISQTK
jgi:hypothetical protein